MPEAQQARLSPRVRRISGLASRGPVDGPGLFRDGCSYSFLSLLGISRRPWDGDGAVPVEPRRTGRAANAVTRAHGKACAIVVMRATRSDRLSSRVCCTTT